MLAELVKHYFVVESKERETECTDSLLTNAHWQKNTQMSESEPPMQYTWSSSLKVGLLWVVYPEDGNPVGGDMLKHPSG